MHRRIRLDPQRMQLHGQAQAFLVERLQLRGGIHRLGAEDGRLWAQQLPFLFCALQASLQLARLHAIDLFGSAAHGFKRRRRRWLNYIGPNKLHRVVLPEAAGADVWTLFFHTARVKDWGILHPAESTGESAAAMRFEVLSEPGDPAHSRWHRHAPTGRELRADPSRNVDGAPAFDIPLGRNAYSAGLARYPESARQRDGQR